MQNVNQTASISNASKLLKTKPEKSNSSKKSVSTKNSTNITSDQLKKKFILELEKVDLTNQQELDQARRDLVKKMVSWHFSSNDYSTSELSRISTKIIEQLSTSKDGVDKINALLSQLKK